VPVAASSINADAGRVKPFPLVVAVLRRPGDLTALMRLAARYRVALRSLHAAARAAFGPPRPSAALPNAGASSDQSS